MFSCSEATFPLPKILGHQPNFDSSMNFFDCANGSLTTEGDRAGGRFMLEAIAAMVVVLGIGFLMAHALDAFRY
jgi:hypothetical protein